MLLNKKTVFGAVPHQPGMPSPTIQKPAPMGLSASQAKPAVTGHVPMPVMGAAANMVNKAQTANTYMNKNFGGIPNYVQNQLNRYQTADATLQGKLTTDLARFGVKPPAPAQPAPLTPSASAGSVNTTGGDTPMGGTGVGAFTGTPSADALKWASTDAYYNQTGGGSLKGAGAADQNTINGVAGLKTKEDELFSLINQKKIEQMNKGYGLTDEWAQKELSPLYSQVYDIEDQMNQKYGINGASDNFSFAGTNRAASGHQTIDPGTGKNIAQSRDAYLYQKDLMNQGVDPQKAYDLANKKFPSLQNAGMSASQATGQPVSPTQQAAATTADYFTKNFGGKEKYAADQNKRYADAYAAGDTALMAKLVEDSKRVGYTLNTPQTGGAATGASAGDAVTGASTAASGTAATPGTPDGVMTYEQATAQANQQLDPLYNAAVASANAQNYQNRLNADELSTARGGAHSGLAADLQNKVNIATANDINQLSAEKASKAASLAQDLVNRSQDNAYRDSQLDIQRGQLTGQYITKEMQAQYAEVAQAKIDYANAKTPEERAAAHKRGDDARAKLAALGANTDVVGSNVTLDQALGNRGKYGIQTQDSLQSEWDRNHTENRDKVSDTQWDKTFNLNNTQVMAELTGRLPDGTPTTADQQRQIENLWTVAANTGTIPDKLADLYGIPRGTQTQAAYQFARGVYESDRNYNRGVLESDRSYNRGVLESDRGYNRGVLESDRNYDLSADDNMRQWATLDGQQSAAGGQKTVSGEVAGGMLAQSLQKTVGVDPATGKPVYGTISDPDTREKAFVDAWNASGVAPGADTLTMLSKAGYTSAEIAKIKKDYPEAFR
jgi:hypothetical protein